MTRHASVHAAGVVITPGAITDYAPLYKGARDEITTQWSMKEIERDRPPQDGLPRPQHADAHLRCHRGDQADDRRRARHRRAAARRSEDLPDFPGRTDLRHLPVREQRDARHPPQGQAAAAGRSDCLERAVPPGAAAQRHGRRLHCPQAGQDRGEVRAAATRADPRRHLRRHRLPGTGDAHLERPRRVLARRGRPAAQGDGEEESRSDGEDARQVPGRRPEERHHREEGRPISSS